MTLSVAKEPFMAEPVSLTALLTGLATAGAAAFGWLVRGRNKQLEVATEWQQQMIERVTMLEQALRDATRELNIERRRTDSLSDDATKWRTEAENLKWQVEAMLENLRDAQATGAAHRERIATLEQTLRDSQSSAITQRERIAVLEEKSARLQQDYDAEHKRAEQLARELQGLLRDVGSGLHHPVMPK